MDPLRTSAAVLWFGTAVLALASLRLGRRHRLAAVLAALAAIVMGLWHATVVTRFVIWAFGGALPADHRRLSAGDDPSLRRGLRAGRCPGLCRAVPRPANASATVGPFSDEPSSWRSRADAVPAVRKFGRCHPPDNPGPTPDIPFQLRDSETAWPSHAASRWVGRPSSPPIPTRPLLRLSR